jgi:hypothetical protein
MDAQFFFCFQDIFLETDRTHALLEKKRDVENNARPVSDLLLKNPARSSRTRSMAVMVNLQKTNSNLS